MDVAETLFQNEQYDWCLFLAHLVLEKIFKALYVQNIGKMAPRIHDLVRMVEYSVRFPRAMLLPGFLKLLC